MKRLLSLLLALCLFLPACALADGDLAVEELEEEDYEVDEEGNIIMLVEADDGDFSFTEDEQEKLEELAEQFEADDTMIYE